MAQAQQTESLWGHHQPGLQGGQGECLTGATSPAQENDQKRIRALKKANKERELKRQRLRELTKAKQEMAALRLEHQRLSAKLQNYSIFNKFLEKVVENSEVSGGGRAFLSPTSSSPGPGAMGGLGTICKDGHLL